MSIDEISSRDTGFDRLPPQDLGAEVAVLGSMLLSKDAISDVSEILHSADFYMPAHQMIFDAIMELFVHDAPADAITVSAELTKRGELVKIGGATQLHTLVSQTPTAANVDYYANIVREKAILRRLVEAGTRIAQIGYAGAGEIESIVDRAESEIFDVTQRRTTEDYKDLETLMPLAFNEIEALATRGAGMHGVGTGFTDLDNYTHGFQPGQLIIVAARPGVGKSTLAMDFARNAVFRQNLPTAFFSLEMSSMEIMFRLLSAETGIELNHLRKGTMNASHYQTLASKMGVLAEGKLYIDDSANLTMMEIRAKARRLKQKHNLAFLVVDYIQLMSSGKKVESRQQEVSEFSRQMKLLAKELEIPVVALSQLNRGPETRSDKRPLLSDLRESGSLEQDADIVILIHKEDAESPRAGEADLILAKNRNGQTSIVPVAFQGHRSRFMNLAQG